MQLPTNPQDREALKEFVSTFWDRQWLRGANIVENHPTQMRKTLEVAVNYKPLNEMLQIRTFVEKHNLGLEFVIVESDHTDVAGG